MKKLDKDILKTLRDYYLLSVRGMALSADEGSEYRRHENAAVQTSCTVFALFGHAAAETLRKDGLREWAKIRVKSVTLAAVLSRLQPHENVFIMHRISPRELEAVGGGTVEELRAIQCVETCGDYEVERLELTVNDLTEDWTGLDKPVLVITIGETEAEA